MSCTGTIRIRNWQKYQHYKKRTPPWIKFHRDVLHDYKFGCLQDASKAHLMLIWLLASQMENSIPADPDWIGKQIGATEPVDLKLLIDGGFLVLEGEVLAHCKQNAPVETETETETYTEKTLVPSADADGTPAPSKPKRRHSPKSYTPEFEELWSKRPRREGDDPKQKAFVAFKARLREGHTAEEMIAGLERYAQHMKSKGEDGTQFVKHTSTFLGPNKGFLEEWPLCKPKEKKVAVPADDQAAIRWGQERGIAARPGESMFDYRVRLRNAVETGAIA